jgi:uncharacterized protein (TIGR03790 family)
MLLPKRVFWLASVLAGLCSAGRLQAAEKLQDHLLVVYNASDPASVELAHYYAQARQIPEERIFGLRCSREETVSREAYETTIRKPIAAYLAQKKWLVRTPRTIRVDDKDLKVQQAMDNKIWSIVLMRGIPLRIDEQPVPPPAVPPEQTELLKIIGTNRASVDSELALITFEGLPIQGFVGNLFFSDQQYRPFNQYFADYLVLVTRLDAPKPEMVRRMIDDAVAVEQTELTGRAYFDARGIHDTQNNYYLGDRWIRETADTFRQSGFETYLDDRPELLAATLPWEEVGFYAGWYAEHVAGAPAQPDFRFRRGAVAYHIHSFSADTLRDPNRNWTGPLVARGAAASMGCVYEPYLRYTPDIKVFYSCLLQGMTFAEAAYHSQMVLSWMTTAVGDPLYRPFPRHLFDTLRIAEQEKTADRDWLLLRLARVNFQQSDEPYSERLRKMSERLLAGPVAAPLLAEGFARILLDAPNVPADDKLEALEKAYQSASSPRAKIRIGLETAALYQGSERNARARFVCEELLKAFPQEAPAFGVQDYLASLSIQTKPAGTPALAPVGQPAPAQPPPPAYKPAIPQPGLNQPSSSNSSFKPSL